MKIKVGFLDKALIKNYLSFLTILSVFFTLGSIFINIPTEYKIFYFTSFIVFLVGVYFLLWIRANLMQKVRLHINNSELEIRSGDIFEADGYKVIAFNEYLDTQVDNVIISETTLNGIYVKRMGNREISQLDKKLKIDPILKEKILEQNSARRIGKKTKYKLGTIFPNDDYFLTAFSKFDNENRAYLYMNDYINFLLNFWNEVDSFYNGRSISIPLLGSGITRLKDAGPITDQELLELLIWSFKISRIKFTYPSCVSILIHDSRMDKINFYKLKEIV